MGHKAGKNKQAKSPPKDEPTPASKLSRKDYEKKLLDLYEMCGGFGTLLALIYDNMENQAGWEKSMSLFAQQVMPRLADVMPE